MRTPGFPRITKTNRVAAIVVAAATLTTSAAIGRSPTASAAECRDWSIDADALIVRKSQSNEPGQDEPYIVQIPFRATPTTTSSTPKWKVTATFDNQVHEIEDAKTGEVVEIPDAMGREVFADVNPSAATVKIPGVPTITVPEIVGTVSVVMEADHSSNSDIEAGARGLAGLVGTELRSSLDNDPIGTFRDPSALTGRVQAKAMKIISDNKSAVLGYFLTSWFTPDDIMGFSAVVAAPGVSGMQERVARARFNWDGDGWAELVDADGRYEVVYNVARCQPSIQTGLTKVLKLAAGQPGAHLSEDDWSAGWTSAIAYRHGEGRYLVSLKESNGKVAIDQFGAGGKVTTTDTEDWTSGWTNADVFYDGPGNTQPYLFEYKSRTGRVAINRLDHSEMGPEMWDRDAAVEAGYEIVRTYLAGGDPYVLFYRHAAAGRPAKAEIRALSGAALGKAVFTTDKWSGSWSNIEVQTIGTKKVMVFYSSESGKMAVLSVGDDGRPGAAIGASVDVGTGYTTTESYETGGKGFIMMINRVNGRQQVLPVSPNTGVGATPSSSTRWAPGWTTAQVYEHGGTQFVFLLKSGTCALPMESGIC